MIIFFNLKKFSIIFIYSAGRSFCLWSQSFSATWTSAGWFGKVRGEREIWVWRGVVNIFILINKNVKTNWSTLRSAQTHGGLLTKGRERDGFEDMTICFTLIFKFPWLFFFLFTSWKSSIAHDSDSCFNNDVCDLLDAFSFISPPCVFWSQHTSNTLHCLWTYLQHVRYYGKDHTKNIRVPEIPIFSLSKRSFLYRCLSLIRKVLTMS